MGGKLSKLGHLFCCKPACLEPATVVQPKGDRVAQSRGHWPHGHVQCCGPSAHLEGCKVVSKKGILNGIVDIVFMHFFFLGDSVGVILKL